jgi:VanZ family protein
MTPGLANRRPATSLTTWQSHQTLSDRLIAVFPPAVHKLRPVYRFQLIARWLFWSLLVAIVVLSVVPSSGRPVTAVPHAFEHIGIFMLLGFSFAAGYWARLIPLAGLIAFTGCVELLQLVAPGRHPRWSDFIENVVGIGFGIIVIYLLNWLLDGFRWPTHDPEERSAPPS